MIREYHLRKANLQYVLPVFTHIRRIAFGGKSVSILIDKSDEVGRVCWLSEERNSLGREKGRGLLLGRG